MRRWLLVGVLGAGCRFFPAEAPPDARQPEPDAGPDAAHVPMDGPIPQGPFPAVDAAFDAVRTDPNAPLDRMQK